MQASLYHKYKDQFKEFQFVGAMIGDEFRNSAIENLVTKTIVPIIIGEQTGIVCPAHHLEDIPFSKLYGLSR